MLHSIHSRRDFILAASALGLGLASTTQPLYGQSSPPLAPPDKEPSDLEIPKREEKKIGWAVVGLGKLAVEEILPAFAECRLSKVTSLVSGHPEKAQKLADVYDVKGDSLYSYDNFDSIKDNKSIDVIYIVLPNHMHAEYTIRALEAGKHVLCEKPMAATTSECEEMIAAATKAKRKLMIAYRLHHEPFNLKVVEMCRNKEFGEIKTISLSNCQNVEAPNIRLSRETAGGPLGDIGIYCINAARYITGEEPLEVAASSYRPKDDPRFREVDESVVLTIRFPSGILASIDCSFGTSESRRYRVHCDKGFIDLDPAFSYRGLRLFTHEGKGQKEHLLREVNHFAAEMDHLSECVLNNREPKSSARGGLMDMRIISACEKSIRTGSAVSI